MRGAGAVVDAGFRRAAASLRAESMMSDNVRSVALPMRDPLALAGALDVDLGALVIGTRHLRGQLMALQNELARAESLVDRIRVIAGEVRARVRHAAEEHAGGEVAS